MDIVQISLTIIIGIISGWVGAVAGGGGLISIPFLLFLGVPPHVTLATSKFGGLGMGLGGLTKFIKEKKVVWKYAIGLAVAGVLASFIGSQILISISTEFANSLIGILLLILAPTIFFKKDFGIKSAEVSSTKKMFGYIAYFFLGILASFFGGLGTLLIPTVAIFFGLSLIKANATDLFSFSILSTSAVIIFIMNGFVDFALGIALFVGMLIGGYIGAHTAIKKGNKFVKAVLVVVIIVSAAKILLG